MFRAAKSAADAMRRLLAPKPVENPRVPDGIVVYAVGDVHGRADLLTLVLAAIREDAAEVEGQCVVVFLGDYVDRGPGSRQVVDLLIEASKDETIEWRFLRGNHDQSVLDFLYNPTTGMAWSDFGGRETLQSYGVQAPTPWADRTVWKQTAETFAEALPASHLHFFQTLELSLEIGGYLFVHAGVRPGVALENQSERDMLWIREPFLSDSAPLPRVVVHGHTPAEAVYADARRIGIDTGAYATGVLTVLRLEGDDGAVIQTEPPRARTPEEEEARRVPTPRAIRRRRTRIETPEQQ
jgi:serine/threonine protein phosphatase 1